MEVWELVARESARDLIARYNANGDSGRIEQMIEVFAPDAVFETGDRRFEGRAAIHDFMRGVVTVQADTATPAPISPALADWESRGRTPMLRHVTGTTQIDVVDEHTMRARSYYLVLVAHGLDHWGRYLDEFGVVDGEWLITRRTITTEGVDPDGWAARLGAGDPE
jgi:hypothetical protein